MPLVVANEETFGNLARQMGKIVDQLNRGYYSFYPNETWTPNVNLYETEDAYQVCVDLAGVDKDKIHLHIDGHALTIKGVRATPTRNLADSNTGSQRRARVHLMEIDHGAFARVVELPHNVVSDRIIASHDNGILWIDIPKT